MLALQVKYTSLSLTQKLVGMLYMLQINMSLEEETSQIQIHHIMDSKMQ